MAGFGPDFASVKDSDLLRGIYIGPERIDSCATPARPGSLARSRSRKLRQRGGSQPTTRQGGGACPCLRPRSRKQRGGMYKIKKTKNKKLKKSIKKQKKQKQRGGAGYTFGIAPTGLDLKTSDMPLGKMPEVVTTPCPKPLPGFYPQIGGGALVGSEISTMTAPLAGTTQLVNPALYNSTPAGVQFKLGQTSVFGPEKIPYPQVDSITSRSLCSAPMTRRRGRNRNRKN
jgi:hypothetical protein